MMEHPTPVSQWLMLTLCWMATLYALVAAFAMPFFSKRPGLRHVGWSPVSVLKPLCGIEPRLYQNLATFCERAHPCFQLLFGVSSPVDPAIGVVRRLQAAYPQCDIELVVDSRVHGSNLKVSNLINMAQRARHDVIVLADSDIAGEPDYLDTVTAPLADADTGVVTCLYRAQSVGGFWPRVGALFVNEWFARPRCASRMRAAQAASALARPWRYAARHSMASEASRCSKTASPTITGWLNTHERSD